MAFKKLKGMAAILALSGATLLANTAKADSRPKEGANLVRTTIEQNGKFNVDFSNTFLGATLAPTDGLDIVTDQDMITEMTSLSDNSVEYDGLISTEKNASEQTTNSEFMQSSSRHIQKAQVVYHRPSGIAFLGFSESTLSQENAKGVKKDARQSNFSHTNTDFQLRVRTDEQLRRAQDWLLASMNTAGHGEASEALWQLFTESANSPLLNNLIKENTGASAYRLNTQQLSKMKENFDKTGTISVPQNTRNPLKQQGR